jgi:hypothetical protein
VRLEGRPERVLRLGFQIAHVAGQWLRYSENDLFRVGRSGMEYYEDSLSQMSGKREDTESSGEDEETILTPPETDEESEGGESGRRAVWVSVGISDHHQK